MRKSSADRRKASVALFLLLLLWTSWAHGQGPRETGGSSPPAPASQSTGASDSKAKQFFRTLLSDQKAYLTAPFRMDGRQAVTIALPLVAGTAGLIAVDQDAAQWLPNTPDRVKWSKRVSQIGAVYTLGGIVGETLLLGKKQDDSEILSIGWSSARALIGSAIVNTGMKYATVRERPLENAGEGRFWKGEIPFPRGIR